MTFWRILLKTQAPTDAPLTCDECIATLDWTTWQTRQPEAPT